MFEKIFKNTPDRSHAFPNHYLDRKGYPASDSAHILIQHRPKTLKQKSRSDEHGAKFPKIVKILSDRPDAFPNENYDHEAYPDL